YLGLHHPHHELRPWRSFTTGVPAALAEPRLAQHVAGTGARLLGVDGAVVSRSTFHALFDVVGVLCDERRPVKFLVGSGAYPVARWALHRATIRGVPVAEFAHHDVGALNGLLARLAPDARPVIVSDGACPACGRGPVADYLEIANRHSGV